MSIIIDVVEGQPTVVHWVLALLTSLLVTLVITPIFSELLSTEKRFWKTQPWASPQKGLFAGLRAHFSTITSIREMAQSGYEKHSKNGRAFAVPSFGSAPWVVLPPSTTKELLNKSDKEIDAEIVHSEQIHRDYTQGKQGLHVSGANAIQFDIVRRQLTRKLPLLTADIVDELERGFVTYWGTNTQDWTSVKCYPSCTKIVTRAANRVFGGNVFCRNEEFLDHSRYYSQGVFGGARLIQMVPKFLRPIIGPMVMWPNRKNEAVCKKIGIPIVKDRLYHTQKKREDPDYEWDTPIDALQWLVEQCLEKNDPIELDPDLITLRLMNLNMVAIHTTSMTTTNAILDLYSSPHAQEFVEGLREECTRILERHDGVWTKAAINEMVRVDSAIRESMRFSDLGWLAMNRMVTAPEGVDFSNDIHVPHGVRVCLPASAIHKDDKFYPNPYEYNAFRFSAPREEYEATVAGKKNSNVAQDSPSTATSEALGQAKRSSKNMLDLKNTSLVTTADDFYGFGHGRHACPGRFFAAQEMKLMLAYLVMNYDVETMPQRPANLSIIGMSVPKDDVQIRIKRRPQASI